MDNDESQKDFIKFWSHISLNTGDETLIVLKGHLLLEDLMSEYCSSKVEDEKPFNEARLSFAQLICMVKAMQKIKPSEWVWPAVKKVNALRNKLAHKLTPKDYEKSRDEFIDFVKKSQESEKLFTSFKKKHEHLAVAIFIVHTALSVNLRFKPHGILTLAMALDDSESSNKSPNPDAQ
ncbi:MAG: hypothetical protein SVR94_09335 [Pseudomonadota bacterium]|nr:hypothetical protein [Pseudomonadota bacterium]